VGLSRPPVRENMLHLLDFDSTGLYTLSYEPNAAGDSSSPNSSVTALPANSYRQFAVSWTGLDEPGGSGLAGYDIYVSKDGGPFSRWLERTGLSGSVYFGDQGSSYSFYSVAIDQAGNRESVPSAPDANTTVSLSNRAPAFAPIGTQDIDEGREFTLTPFASDPDAGDSLQFSLVSAPSGMTINPSTGQLRWLTSEGTGPRTTQVVLRVQDQGEPPLSATTEFTLIVREVNTPPTLAAIPDRTINEGSLLEFTNVVSDLDLPANTFTFSLAPGAPAGATVNPVTGVFRWRPTETQGPSTNRITILVADNGQPSLSDARSFQVIVRDFLSDFSLSLGRTALLAGEAGSVPVTLRSGLDLTSLTLWLGSSDIHLSDLNLRGMGPEVLGASLVSTSENLSRLSFILDPALAPGNNRVVAALDFLAVDQPHSAIIPLAASGLQARRADGTLVTNGRAVSGQVIVVGAEPVLESTWENAPQITLYGRPGSTYDVETAARLQSPPQWHPWTSVTMTNISQVLTWPNPSDPQRFFRRVSP